MGKIEQPHGTVLRGDYEGLNVYNWNKTRFIITEGRINNKVFGEDWNEIAEISKSTVERYEDISSATRGADVKSVSNATFWFGATAGVLASTMGQTTSYDIAIYFKDGKKSLIRLYYPASYQALKTILFDF